jgi:hypothetical protein
MTTEQAKINKLNEKLRKLDIEKRNNVQRRQIKLIERQIRKTEVELMKLYGTEKYSLA